MSASKLRSHAITVWHWLFPVYDRDFSELTTVPPLDPLPEDLGEARALQLLELERRAFERQMQSQARLDGLRDRLLSLALTGSGLMISTMQATRLHPLIALPAGIFWLLAAIYIVAARQPTWRPIETSGSTFARVVTPDVTSVKFISCVLDSLAATTAEAKAFSACLSRHVRVGSALMCLGLLWMTVCLLLSLAFS